MIYIYSDHLGGSPYYTTFEIPYEDLYCEQCGDSDMFLGAIESVSDAYPLIEDFIPEVKESFIKDLESYFAEEGDYDA